MGRAAGILGAIIAMAGAAVAQTQYSIGNPTNEEQYMLELVNRARANGTAEATRLGLSSLQEGAPNYNGETWTIANTNQPLSWNQNLANAAQGQATNLNNGDQFFSGVSPHTYGGMTPQQRIAAAGFSEAAYSGPTTSPSHYYPGPETVSEAESYGDGGYGGANLAPAVLQAHNDLFTDLDVPGRGHRSTMMLGFFREVGIGISTGTDFGDGDTWDSLYIVQDYGTHSSTPFITGVVYQDVNGNGFYDPGEGIGGVRVDVSGASYYGITAASGGYSVPVSANGSYTVTFSGGNVATAQATATVSGLLNTKIDYVALVLAPVTNIARSGNTVTVTFNAIAGRSYRLERKLNMTDATWTDPVPGVADITPSTTTAQLTDPNGGAQPHAFYRVRLLP